MAEETKIEWADATFSPWRGCTKVSEACRNCYAETMSKRNPKVLGVWGPQGTRVVAAEKQWLDVVRWNAEAAADTKSRRVFCASLADVFEDWQGPMETSHGVQLWKRVDHGGEWTTSDHYRDTVMLTMDDVRKRLFTLIAMTPYLTWLILTKRPENIAPTLARLRGVGLVASDHFPWGNVWYGTTVENQAAADERIPHLLGVPAAVRFLSCEPLLGPVDLVERFKDGGHRNYLTGQFHGIPAKGVNGNPDFTVETADPALPRIHWVIAGGESGHGARPMHPMWARMLREQCRSNGVPFHFKQWGEYAPDADVFGPTDEKGVCVSSRRGLPKSVPLVSDGGTTLARVGKKAAGRLLDGREWNDFPEEPT